MLDLPFFVILCELLFVIVKAGSETTFSIFVHFAGTNLEFYDVLIFGNYCGMERLVAILLRHSDIVFNAAIHRCIQRVDYTKR